MSAIFKFQISQVLYFLEKTPWLLFISALLQCGDYSRAATIRSTDVAATIYFSSTAMWRLFEGGYYSKYRRCSYYLFQLYRNVVTIRGRLLFEVQTSRLLFISALPQCGDYSRAATIRSTDVTATIYFSSTAMQRLFEGGYYSKYRRHGYYLFQLYRNVATIRSTDVTATIYFSSTAMQRLFEGGYYSRKYGTCQLFLNLKRLNVSDISKFQISPLYIYIYIYIFKMPSRVQEGYSDIMCVYIYVCIHIVVSIHTLYVCIYVCVSVCPSHTFVKTGPARCVGI